MTAPRRWPAYLLLIFLFVVWSNSFVAARVLVGEQVPADQRLAPLPFVVARFLPVALVTWPWLLLSRRRRAEVARLLREHGPLIVGLGLISVWVYNLPFAAGQRLVPPGAASLIITLNPVLTFLLAVGLRVERFAAVRAAGLALAFAGVWQVVVHGAGREVHGAYLTDALLLTLSPLSWALYTVLGKRLLGVASPLLVTYLTLALASAPTIPIALADAGLRATVARWPVERWAAALFLGLACTLLGYWLWNVALRRLPATTVASFVFLNPPLAILFEWLWLGNAPTWGLLLGGALVLAGVRLCLLPERGARGVAAIAPPAPRVETRRPGWRRASTPSASIRWETWSLTETQSRPAPGAKPKLSTERCTSSPGSRRRSAVVSRPGRKGWAKMASWPWAVGAVKATPDPSGSQRTRPPSAGTEMTKSSTRPSAVRAARRLSRSSRMSAR